MRRVFIILFVVLFFIAFSVLFGIHIYNNSSGKGLPAAHDHLSDAELSLIRDGDIILRYGNGFASDMIVRCLSEKFKISHCAIICRDSSRSIVVHSVSRSLSPYDGVQSQELGSFIDESLMNSVIIVRYKPKTAGRDGSGLSRRARYYLNRKIPFDDAFDPGDSTAVYCQELLRDCIRNEFGEDIYHDLDVRNKEHLGFTAFYDTSRFTIILNHQQRQNKP